MDILYEGYTRPPQISRSYQTSSHCRIYSTVTLTAILQPAIGEQIAFQSPTAQTHTAVPLEGTIYRSLLSPLLTVL